MLIQTTNGRTVWTTVGVGPNIIEASWEALSDGYLYGLLHADDTHPKRSAVGDREPARV